jgi:amidase
MSAAAHDAIFVQTMSLGGSDRGSGGGHDSHSRFGPALRVGIKDSLDIAGYPTRAGSAVFAAARPALRNAAVVQALLDGGCRIVGKTNMHELAYGVTGINAWTGTPLNPRYPDRVPGGSSSGSAVAVAAEHVDFAIGTDTGGSIRVPAACCGIYGFKPTYGRISRSGAVPMISTLDCIGPFARDLAMIERAMALMDATFVPKATPAVVRVGVVALRVAALDGAALDAAALDAAALDAAADPAVCISAAVHRTVRGALDDAANRRGTDTAGKAGRVTLTPIELPSFEPAFAAGITLIGAENWAAFGHLADSPGLGPDVRARLLAARDITAAAVAAAEACRTRFRAEVDAALERVDVLALPTLPDFPLPLAAALDPRAALRTTALVRQFNVSGHPALTIPLMGESLPVGLQLVGRRGEDAALCALARRIDREDASCPP